MNDCCPSYAASVVNVEYDMSQDLLSSINKYEARYQSENSNRFDDMIYNRVQLCLEFKYFVDSYKNSTEINKDTAEKVANLTR